MAAVESRDDTDSHSSMVDAKLDRYKESNNKSTKSSSSKSKDLSHVPCKFFKVGSCTAGSSCPFSHQVQQPGQQKDVCAWFVKGNCKFGHKCALAHILPGQSPSMDRRNKKAAQLAAAASAGVNNGGGTTSKDQHRDKDSRTRKTATGAASASRSDVAPGPAGSGGHAGTSSRSNSLLSGSTAPTRMLPTGVRPPLPISISKAAPAPAETAPALRDADFASPTTATLPRAANDDQRNANIMRQIIGQGDASKENKVVENKNATNDMANLNAIHANGFVSSPPRAMNVSPFPVSTPPRPHRFADRQDASPSIDFGPVGSPPRAGHLSPSSNNNSTPIRINGFSPGTSPRDPVQNTQPLAAPGPPFGATTSSGNANLFMNPSSPRGAGAVHSGLAASLSLGATTARGAHTQHTAQPFSVGSLPVLSRQTPDMSSISASGFAYSEVLDEEDMEEFVPSSLKDLLTPEEQNRRMSRASSSRASGAAGGTGGTPTSIARSAMTIQREDSSRHRHSRSVPSTSLLSRDLRSIWSDNGGELGMESNPGFGLSPSAIGGLAAGTSPSFSPSHQTFDKYDAATDCPSPGMLSPSNASAAFLGLHQYMGGANSRTSGGAEARAASQGNIRLHSASGITSTSSMGIGVGAGTGNNGNVAAGLNHLPSASSSFDPHTLNSRFHVGAGVDGMSSSPSSRQLGGIANTLSPFDAFPSSGSSFSKHAFYQQTAALSTGVGGVGGVEPPIRARPAGAPGHQLDQQALSPASRALQAHVPGQSLPQGLAAGFSRIHLRPTATAAAFSPGSQISEGLELGGDGTADSNNTKTNGEGQEWMSATLTKQNNFDHQQQPQSLIGDSGASRNAILTGWSTGESEASSAPEKPGSTTARSVGSNVVPTSSTEQPESQSQSQFQSQSDVGGLTKMFSHLSYSSVAAGGLRGSPALPTAVSPTSASASRRSSARTVASGWGVGGSHPLSSPLSGPVLTNDDDDLFSMDEEK